MDIVSEQVKINQQNPVTGSFVLRSPSNKLEWSRGALRPAEVVVGVSEDATMRVRTFMVFAYFNGDFVRFWSARALLKCL